MNLVWPCPQTLHVHALWVSLRQTNITESMHLPVVTIHRVCVIYATEFLFILFHTHHSECSSSLCVEDLEEGT